MLMAWRRLRGMRCTTILPGGVELLRELVLYMELQVVDKEEGDPWTNSDHRALSVTGVVKLDT